jgi:hypothetical protein
LRASRTSHPSVFQILAFKSFHVDDDSVCE